MLAAWPAPAQADRLARARARPIAQEGIALFNQGKYEAAIERFERADKLYTAPQNQIYIGRSHAKLGRLILARDAYERARQIHQDDEPKSFEPARGIAEDELEALRPRIPWLEIDVAGEALPVTVLVDGKQVPESEWPRWEVDPGRHAFIAQAGDRPVRETQLSVGEGERQTININIEAPQEAPTAVEAGGGSASPLLILSGFSFGVGGVGLVLGGVTGALAIDKVNGIEEQCGDATCPDALREEQGEARTLATVSNAGFIVGGVGIAAGVVLLVVELVGGDEPAEDATLVPLVGPGYGGLQLRF